MTNAFNTNDCFITVLDAVVSEEIKRSQFIAYVKRVDSDDDAIRYLSELRAKHYDATHVCYAYVTDSTSRFSDDGEPSGTAGKPILDVITLGGYKRTLIAVVRYFGGIKLGTGGLSRAYSGVAKQAINLCEKVKVELCDVYTVTLEYSVLQKIQKNLVKLLCKIVDKAYNDNVTLTVAVRVSNSDGFIKNVNELTLGKVTPLFIERRYEEILTDEIYL